MAQEPIEIPIRVKGARKAKREIEGLGESSKKSEKGVASLTAGLKVLAGAAVVREIAGLGVEFQQLERRILAVSDGAEDAQRNLQIITRVSRQTRSNISANAEAFQRLSIATERIGVSSEQASQVLTTLNQAFAVGGVSASEQAAALTQLGQALASGKLNGDELRSLTENASFLANALGNEIGGKGIASLRELSAQGKLTSEVLIDAFLKVGGDIEEQYKSLPKTLGEAFTELRTELTLLGESLVPAINGISKSFSNIATSIRISSDALTIFNEKINRAIANRTRFRRLEGLDAGRDDAIEQAQGLRRLGETLIASANRQVATTGTVSPQLVAEIAQVDAEYRKVADSLGILTERSSKAADVFADEIPSSLQKSQDAFLKIQSALGVEGLEGGGGGAAGGGERDLSGDPILQALEARQAKETELTKAHLDRINALSQEAFEKDLARYRFQEQALTAVFNTATDALLEYTRTGELDFKEFGASILETLQQILIQALITQAVTGLLGGAPTAPGTISGLGESGIPLAPQFAGGFADGGTIPAGQFGVVGEQGPEFISGPATITPMGGGSVTVNVSIGGRQIAPEVLDVIRSEDGARAQLDTLSKKSTQAKRLLS